MRSDPAPRPPVLLLLLAALVLAGAVSARIPVVASTSQIGDIVAAVAGERVELKVLMGPGVDPHLYKATARDVMELQRAEVIFYNGLHLEGRLAQTFEKVARRGRTVVAVAESVPLERRLRSADYEGAYDPHIWFDPRLWAYAVDAVADTLAMADAPFAGHYREAAAVYKAELAALADWTAERIASLPESRRALITSHDAYSYFGQAFGIQVIGVQGISTATEAGIADVTKTIDFIKRRGIPAIFVESSVAPGTIRRISADSGAVVGGELFSDALGAPGDMRTGSDGTAYDVGTYLGMFRYNVDTIVTALGR